MARTGQLAAEINREELLALVSTHAAAVRLYLEWALPHRSMRMENRLDIEHAAETAKLFAEPWWAFVVFTSFGSKFGAEAVAPHFQVPLRRPEAEAILAEINFPTPAVGHHRGRRQLPGAKTALAAACARHDLFRRVLLGDGDFEDRFQQLRTAGISEWGRTTIFDLLLRTGAREIGGQRYLPEFAYLAGLAVGTGPRKGFAAIFGEATPQRAESVLRAWAENWTAVCVSTSAWNGKATRSTQATRRTSSVSIRRVRRRWVAVHQAHSAMATERSVQAHAGRSHGPREDWSEA